MAWAHMKYTSVGVVEVDPVPNEPAIELPDLLQPPAPTAGKATGKAPAPTPGKAPAFSKASAPNGAASAPSGAAPAVEGASAKAPPPVVPAKAQAFTATPPPKKPDLEREIQVRIPVLVNTRDVQPGDELIRRDMKMSSKRAYDPVNESSLLKKGARHG